MSTGIALTSWEDFLALPNAGSGEHYELHDGEVVVMPPPRPIHVYIQSVLVQWLTDAANGLGRAAQEFPYRPAKNMQFWHADVAFLPNEHWELMRGNEYPIYAPALIIEVLSPSNTMESVNRQRIAAFSGGTLEFLVVDPVREALEVSIAGLPSRQFGPQESAPVSVLPGVQLPLSLLFQRR